MSLNKESSSEEFINRLKKNAKKRASLKKSWPTQALRLYGMDLPNYPYLIDLYLDYALIWTKTREEFADDLPKEDLIRSWLIEEQGIDPNKIIFKKREPRTRTEHYQKFATLEEYQIVQEAQAQFWVNLHDYLDTGLFLDHRILRRWVKKDVLDFVKKDQKTPSFLNLFCYTSSVSVSAALAGAKTVNVDLSHRYLEWGQENFLLNKIDPLEHYFIRQSAMSAVTKAQTKIEKYDFIYIDPPTFSNSKSAADFDVQEDHPQLIEDNMKLLSQTGLMYFSCNKRNFKLDETIKSKYTVVDKSLASIPEDFDDKKIHQLYFIKHKN